MQRKPFGQTRDGQAVEIITLDNDQLSCTFLTYGATLVSLNVPDKEGKMVDVALGYDTLDAYESQDKYLGATVGRYANRIAAGELTERVPPTEIDELHLLTRDLNTIWPSTTETTISTAAPPASPPGYGRPKRSPMGSASPTTARTWRRVSPAPSPPR